MADVGIGVDLGGTNLRIAAVDEKGKLLRKITLETQVARGPERVIDEMCVAIRELLEANAKAARVMGIGIGVPGIIDMSTGLVRESPNLPGWAEFPVRSEIERRLGAPVILENDANAAALGESWLGAARGLNSAMMITLGTGVGGGIVLHGQIWHGMTGMAGEVGHITIEPDGVPCPCGNIGCAERYASAKAIVRMAREKIAQGNSPALARAASGGDVEFNARVIYDLAARGDKAALEIFHCVGRALGILVADLVNLLNLEMYVIGGGVSAAWDIFSPSLFQELRKRSLVYAATAPPEISDGEIGASVEVKPAQRGQHTRVTQAALGSDAGLYGAARLSLVPAKQIEHAHTRAPADSTSVSG